MQLPVLLLAANPNGSGKWTRKSDSDDLPADVALVGPGKAAEPSPHLRVPDLCLPLAARHIVLKSHLG